MTRHCIRDQETVGVHDEPLRLGVWALLAAHVRAPLKTNSLMPRGVLPGEIDLPGTSESFA